MRRCTAILAVVATCGLTACQRADEQAAETGATTLTVYASLPLQGPAGPDSEAVANGARLALREAGGRAGALVVKLVTLDDSTTKAGRWEPQQAAENARVAVRDRTAIAYLGDGPSGATAISLPILNAAGILQVSPTSGYVGLTRAGDGGGVGEPERFSPSGRRSFARPVPADDVQARALLAGLEERRCRRLQLFDDRDLAGRGLSGAVERAAGPAGVEVVGRDGLSADVDVAREAARAVERDADCVLVAASLADWAPRLFDALHAAEADLELFGSDGLAVDAFAAALRSGTQARTRITAPPGVLEPLPGVRAFTRRYRDAFGIAPRSGSLYGHEAMRLVLAAIGRAGARGDNRTAVMGALFALGERDSPLGSYRLDVGGDTSSTAYSVLGVREGRLVRRRTATFPAA